jgi:hypothetical protein
MGFNSGLKGLNPVRSTPKIHHAYKNVIKKKEK